MTETIGWVSEKPSFFSKNSVYAIMTRHAQIKHIYNMRPIFYLKYQSLEFQPIRHSSLFRKQSAGFPRNLPFFSKNSVYVNHNTACTDQTFNRKPMPSRIPVTRISTHFSLSSISHYLRLPNPRPRLSNTLRWNHLQHAYLAVA